MFQVFEGPLCCNTGVCGPNPDQALVNFTSDLDWLSRQGVTVQRANLAQDPNAFADSTIARGFVQKVGTSGLPLIVVDDVTVATGRYPSRAELAKFAGLEASGDFPTDDDSRESGAISAEAGCCGYGADSGCCSSAQPVSITTAAPVQTADPVLGSTKSIRLLENAPRFLFLTGKGGVGKTSIACATAVELARENRKVLLVSTDPASNIGHVFGQKVGYAITPITGVDGLDALEIDPEAAAEEYRQRALAPIRDLLSAKDLSDVTEQLSGSCTTEIASFNEFTGFLAGNGVANEYDHIVFDTAPTGHTIRLLKLPGEWSSFLDVGLGDASCLGPMAGLDRTRATYNAALSALADPNLTRLGLVTRPQVSSLIEASRTVDELSSAGVRATNLIINGILPDEEISDHLADAIRADEATAMKNLPGNLAGLVTDRLSLHTRDVMGLDALSALLSDTPEQVTEPSQRIAATPESTLTTEPRVVTSSSDTLAATIEQLAERDHGLVMLVGKGGVGKTTMASAIALGLADRGKDVLLTTTDPAAHLKLTVGDEAPFEVSSIDPERAVADYRQHVMDTKGANLDAEGQANLAEDLRSPCTEEVAVFQAFSAAVKQSTDRFVVMDTAPTGHTLLLMDATGSYDREVARNLPDQIGPTPLALLQDPDNTSVIIVTLPESTPVLEATGLAADLTRANIGTWGWIVNRSLTPTDTNSPLLAERVQAEGGPLHQVAEQSDRIAVVPYSRVPPVGLDRLRAFWAHETGALA